MNGVGYPGAGFVLLEKLDDDEMANDDDDGMAYDDDDGTAYDDEDDIASADAGSGSPMRARVSAMSLDEMNFEVMAPSVAAALLQRRRRLLPPDWYELTSRRREICFIDISATLNPVEGCQHACIVFICNAAAICKSECGRWPL